MKRLFLFLVVFVQAIVGFAENWVDFAEEPAKNPEGVYVITKATELAWVAKQTQTAVFDGSLIITNDIDLSGKQWTPLGYNGSTTTGATGFYYNGSIDGQGHTISGLDIQTGADDVSAGFIGGTNNKEASIKNLNIAGTMTINNTSKGADFGSLIGFANAMSSVENCHSSVTILCNGASVGSYLGGLVGRMKATDIIGCSYTGSISIIATSKVGKGLGGILGSPNSSTSGATGSLCNSVFAGSINVEGTIGSSGTAALVGYANLSKGVFTIANNYVNGTMIFNTIPTNCAVIVGQAATLGSKTVLSNNYIVQSTGLTDSNATIATDGQLYGGELCWLLNGGQHNFTQDLSVEKSVPMPKAGEKVYKTIFMNEGETYATSFNNATISFPANPEKVDYTFNGWYDAAEGGNKIDETTIADRDTTLFAQYTENPKDIWDGVTLTAITPDETGVYHVTTGAELAWVASESNKDIITWNIVLDNSIYLGNHAWTPIGQDKAFNGVFDGQGYTINDLYIEATSAKKYWGLFGNTNTSSGNPAAIIKNVNINGNMNIVSGTDGNNIGTLIGYSNNGIPEFTNCHSAVNISMNVATGANYLGGLIGLMKAGHFTSCSYSGTMTFGADASFAKGWGGLVGSFNSGTSGLEGSIKNCWFGGEIKSLATVASTYGAYLCGYPSLSKGSVTLTGNYINGTIEITGATPTNFGNIYSKNNTKTIVATNNYGVGITGDDNVIPTDATQLHNGELCWMLNGDQTQIAFGQTLKDAESVPVVATADNRVFKTTYIVADTVYAATFTNGKVLFPAEPVDPEHPFIGWYDQPVDGNQITDATIITCDTTFYAHFYGKADDVIRILGIGNSFTMDALESHFAGICKSTNKKVIFAWPYIGGTQLSDHVANLQSHYAGYKYYKNVDYKTTTTSNTELMAAIKDEPWDYVVIQQGHYRAGVLEDYFPYVYDLVDSVKNNISNPTAKFIMFMTWADDEGCTKTEFQTYYNRDQMKMYEAVRDASVKVADSIHAVKVIPAATTMQNCRTTYIGQNMTRDGYHMNYDYGRYVLGLTWYETIFEDSALHVTYKPAAISDNMAELCRNAAHYAILKPLEITDMSKEWGVNPDIKNEPLYRPVNISFDTKLADYYGGTDWNAVKSADKTSSQAALVDNKLGSTAVTITMNSTMTGDYVDGPAVTTTPLDMPEQVSRTAFTAQGDTAAIYVTGLYAGQKYDFNIFASLKADEALNTKFLIEGATKDSVTVDIANNTDKLFVIKNIKPDFNGRVVLTLNSADAKLYGINAMQIVPYLRVYDPEKKDSVDLDPTHGIPVPPVVADVWDGTTIVEPLKGSNDWYIITSGDELAWIATQANIATFSANLLITKDIDLGDKPWLVIGKGVYYNGSINGNHHTIRGLYLNPAAADVNCGLIGQCNNSTAFIRDLNLEGRMLINTMHSGSNADYGSLIGLNNAMGTVENCHSNVNIDIADNSDAAYIGGLCGRVKATHYISCSYSGTFTIAESAKVTSGWGGLIGTFNSNSTKDGGMNGCWFNGTIDSKSTSTAKYGAAICGYPRLYKSACVFTNNYAAGSMSVAVAPTNYGIIYGTYGSDGQGESACANNYNVELTATGTKETVKPIAATVAQMYSGELARNLNGGEPVGLFGQDLSVFTSHPVVFADSIVVLKTDYVISAGDTTVVYNNHSLIFPENPVVEGFEFIGWFDAAEGGNQYTDGDNTDSDLTVYAHFKQATGIEEIESQSTVNGQQSTAVYNLQGLKVNGNHRGIVIRNGKKYVVK